MRNKWALASLWLIPLFSPVVATGADSPQTLFEKAQAGGAVYELAAQQLIKLGEAARPLLEKELSSEEWRRRWVAKIALSRMDDAQSHARWKAAQTNRRSIFTRREDDEMMFELRGSAPDAQLTELKMQNGDPIPAEALAPAMDILMSLEGKELRPEDGVRSYQVLAQHGDELLFDAAVAYARSSSYRDLPFYAKRIGASVLPKLHAVLSDADPKEDRWRIHASLYAITALGQSESAPVLLASIERASEARLDRQMHAALLATVSAESLPALVKLVADERQSHHRVFRPVIIAIGETALPGLDAIIRDPRQTPRMRAILGGIAYEIRNPDEMNAFYRALATVTYNGGRPVERLDEKREQALIDNGKYRWWKRQPETEFLALDELPEEIVLERAVDGYPFFEPLAQNEIARQFLQQKVTAGDVHGTFARSAGRVFGKDAVPMIREGLKKANPRANPYFMLGTLLEIGHPDAAVIADGINSDKAKTIARALRGEKQPRQELMSEDLRESDFAATVTVAFLRQGDLDAIPAAMEMFFIVNRRFDSHPIELAIASIGEQAIPAIRAVAANSETPFMDVIADGLICRIENPELAAKYDIAVKHGGRQPVSILVPDAGNYRFRGSALVRAVGEKGIPLLRMGIAATGRGAAPHGFALAQLKHNDSLELIRAHLPNMGTVHNLRSHTRRAGPTPTRYLGAEILRDFGEAGIELAKDIPAPDPNLARVDSRAMRHTRSAAALGGIDEALSLEKILEGLQLAAEGKLEGDAIYRYLNLAAKHDDKRIIEPAVTIFGQHPSWCRSVTLAVYKYDDSSIAPACLETLKKDPRTHQAWRGLTRAKHGETLDYIIAAIAAEENVESRLNLIGALGEFRKRGAIGSLVDRSKMKVSAAGLSKMESRARKLLIRYADGENDPKTRVAAAVALAKMIEGKKDLEVVRILAQHRIDTGDWAGGSMRRVMGSRDRQAFDMLVAHYRKNRNREAYLAHHLLEAGRSDLIPDLVAVVEARIGKEEAREEIEWLAGAGKRGRDALYALTKQHDSPDFLFWVFHELAQVDDVRAYSRVEKLFKQEVAKEKPGGVAVSYAGILARMSWKYSYPVISAAALEVEDQDIRKALAGIAADLAKRHPQLAAD